MWDWPAVCETRRPIYCTSKILCSFMLVLLIVVFDSPTLSFLFYLWDWSANGSVKLSFGLSASFSNDSRHYSRKKEYVYDFEWNMDSWFMYVKSLYHCSPILVRLIFWTIWEIIHSLYVQCVLVIASTCNYELLRSLLYWWVIPHLYLISTLIRVPQCL